MANPRPNRKGKRWLVLAAVAFGCFGPLPVPAQAVLQPGDGALTAERISNSLPVPGNPRLPSLFLIGDSTVRNGRGDGGGGQWGWGEPLSVWFDASKINVVNRALGGTTSRTYYRNLWPQVLALIKPGDFVILQFGTNDGGPINDDKRARGSLKGVGEETQAIENQLTHEHEVVHSFGWYERTLITEARAHGATPLVCSLIPRNNWKAGRAVRNAADYGGWAGQAAAAEHAPFLDINEIIARQYDALGRDRVQPLFIVGAGPHTSRAGAETNAICVIAALKGLPENPLAPYFSPQAADIQPYVAAIPNPSEIKTP